ncbi:MAG: hypothetical protein ATN36_06910 [Epulopiscium sp. Nele67-Bin005]|nr:MAG: hypothetical protein ATN36_06910 [Epulopiscium sp. Nele67-Bin005]
MFEKIMREYTYNYHRKRYLKTVRRNSTAPVNRDYIKYRNKKFGQSKPATPKFVAISARGGKHEHHNKPHYYTPHNELTKIALVIGIILLLLFIFTTFFGYFGGGSDEPEVESALNYGVESIVDVQLSEGIWENNI